MRQKSGKYFEVVVAFEKMGEDGLTHRTKETVVVEAFNLSEAEQRALEEYAPLAVGAPECVKAGLASYKEIFFADEGDIFYKARVALWRTHGNFRTMLKNPTNLLHFGRLLCKSIGKIEPYFMLQRYE